MIILECPYCKFGILLEKEEDYRESTHCPACLKLVAFGRLIDTSRIRDF
jgi:hypothetical protein